LCFLIVSLRHDTRSAGPSPATFQNGGYAYYGRVGTSCQVALFHRLGASETLGLALWPIGKMIVPIEEARRGRYRRYAL
jgi:hypothetical protein